MSLRISTRMSAFWNARGKKIGYNDNSPSLLFDQVSLLGYVVLPDRNSNIGYSSASEIPRSQYPESSKVPLERVKCLVASPFRFLVLCVCRSRYYICTVYYITTKDTYAREKALVTKLKKLYVILHT